MKKIISFFLIFLMGAVCAKAQPLYSNETEEIVTGGVSLKNIQRFYGDYALNINYITADLKNENLSLELLKHSGGVDKTETVMNLSKQEENVVTAMNADFFSAYKNGQNFSLGIEVKDGKFLQSHINKDMAAGFLKDNALSLSYLDFTGTVTAPDGTLMPLSHINKPTDYYGALLMYTSDFNGGISPYLPSGITALTVTDGKVCAKGTSLGGTIPVPQNGYILVIDDNMTPFLEYKFELGDEVDLKIEASPSLEGVNTAFGGGTLLLSDGQKTKITHDVSGNNPRSAIGTNADGSVIYMITVDGRQTQSRGVSLDTLADICLEIGCVNAMNLDGGGSTALVGKTLTEKELHYINSPTENRKVINAVAITSDAVRGEAVGFMAEAQSKNVLTGDSVRLTLTAYDENYNTPKSIKGSPKWIVAKGKGYVRDNVYYADGSGETLLQLEYNGKITDECTINVIDSVSGIIADEKFSINVGGTIPTEGIVQVFDEYGATATVRDITLLNPKFDADFISVDSTNITALKEGGAPLRLSYGKAERSIKIVSGNYETDADSAITDDPLYSNDGSGFSFNVLGAKKPTTLFDRIVYARAMDVFRKADASGVLGSGKIDSLTPQKLNPVTGSSWGEYNHENVKIISLALSEGKLKRGSQWKDLSSALSKDSHKNIIVLLDSAPEFVSDIDKAAFSNMLSESAKDKNVFVVYNGSENFCRIHTNVRYISIADAKDESMLHKAIQNTKYLSFNITDENITYCFKNLYE